MPVAQAKLVTITYRAFGSRGQGTLGPNGSNQGVHVLHWVAITTEDAVAKSLNLTWRGLFWLVQGASPVEDDCQSWCRPFVAPPAWPVRTRSGNHGRLSSPRRVCDRRTLGYVHRGFSCRRLFHSGHPGQPLFPPGRTGCRPVSANADRLGSFRCRRPHSQRVATVCISRVFPHAHLVRFDCAGWQYPTLPGLISPTISLAHPRGIAQPHRTQLPLDSEPHIQ
jgi:hypothetical protein